MKFKLDENLPVEILDDLRAAGHDVHSVPDQGLSGAPDLTMVERVRKEGRALLTMDKGIANVRVYPPERFSGIVLFRPRASGRGAVPAFVRQHLPAILQTDLAGRLLVVSERDIRIR
jgi:predicted nuclease of predicted toxin-antitoxin system